MAERILIATHNKGKVAEFRELLEPLGYEVVSAGDLGLPEPDETGTTFEANAELKAVAAARAANVPAIADDSGLAVVGLDGAPGIYSARWAGESKDFSAAMARVANELEARGINPTGAAAYFVCALSLAQPDGSTQTLRGEVHGTLTFPARGTRGFGYDPIFIAEGMQDTFGEIAPDEKHAISHRARAFAHLLPLLSKERAA